MVSVLGVCCCGGLVGAFCSPLLLVCLLLWAPQRGAPSSRQQQRKPHSVAGLRIETNARLTRGTAIADSPPPLVARVALPLRSSAGVAFACSCTRATTEGHCPSTPLLHPTSVACCSSRCPSLLLLLVAAMTTAARRRLLRDLKRITSDPPVGIIANPDANDLLVWHAVIFG